MRSNPHEARGRRRETPFAYAGLLLAVLFVAGAAASLATDGVGRWSVARLVVALLYAAYAVWFLLRARRQPGQDGLDGGVPTRGARDR